jgi:hypothetical protein
MKNKKEIILSAEFKNKKLSINVPFEDAKDRDIAEIFATFMLLARRG